jgi:hypothetical protein
MKTRPVNSFVLIAITNGYVVPPFVVCAALSLEQLRLDSMGYMNEEMQKLATDFFKHRNHFVFNAGIKKINGDECVLTIHITTIEIPE